MTAFYPGIASLTLDGDMSDWAAIQGDQDNNICDAPPGVDLDGKIQSTGRDLMQFTYTFDSSYVYAYTQRVSSDSNTDNFIYYADTNNNGIMETGEPVVVVGWQGSNRSVDVYIGTYQSYYAGGDPMVCTAGYTAGQNCTIGKADGYHLPGTVVNLPSPGHPNYSGQWGSTLGTEMEWRVSWADLGMASTPGRAFSFHVSSTNSQPGAGSFPAQIDDNMGGCGGGGGSSQYAGVTISAGSTNIFPTSLALNLRHTITNTGNGNDAFALALQTASGLAPASVAFYQDNGSGQPTGPALTATPTIAPNGTFAVVAILTWNAGPNVNGPGTYTVTATSNYDSRYSAPATDTVQAAPWITIAKQTTNNQYGSFGFCGTNGPPACTSPVTVTTAAGTNPATVRYLAAVNTQTTITEQTVPAGWDLAGIQCSDGTNSIGTASGATVTIPSASLVAGANLTCTFTNKKRATITVQKALAPTTGNTDTFALKVGATTVATGGDAASGSTTVAADTSVTISETEASGSLANYYTAYSCTDGTSGTGTSFLLTPAAGASVTCTFSNTKWTTLTIVKSTSSGHNNTTFTYDITGPNNFSTTATVTINNQGNGTSATKNLPTGKTGPFTYDIVEEALGGWTTAGIACTGAASTATDPNNNRRIFINVNPGTAVTCTYTNVYTSNPQVVVKKQSFGGTGTFTYSGGTNGLPASLTLNTGTANPDTSSTYSIITAGSPASITETLQSGWSLTGIDCRDGSGTAIPNSSGWLNTSTGTLTIPGTYLVTNAFAACTFLNNKDASLTIQKTAAGGDGQFSFNVSGANGFAASRNVTTAGGSGSATVSLPAPQTGTNSYTLAESSLPAGWSMTNLSCTGATGAAPVYDMPNKTASFGIKPGDTVTCTFTNVLPAALTVVKSADRSTAKPGEVITYTIQVVNSGAGTAANVVLDDGMSTYTSFRLQYDGTGPLPFQFLAGASGLTLGVPLYSVDHGATWTYAPVSGGGGAPAGYDGAVTTWQIPMTGAMNGNGASFTLKYQTLAK